MTTIYLVRHAEAEGNLYRRVHGWYDSRITDRGFRQIAALEERFRDIPVDAVWSSDLLRTRTTARAVYGPKGLELHTTPALREVGMGEWEDLPWGLVARLDPERLKWFTDGSPRWGDVTGSESFAAAQERAWNALRDIAAANPGGTVAVFSHGMVIRTLLARCQGLPPEGMSQVPHSDNTGVACLRMEGDRVELVHGSDASHLTEELSTFAGQRWWRDKKGALADANLWYRPLDIAGEADWYRAARSEAWQASHGTMDRFDGAAFLRAAQANARDDGDSLICPMLGETPAGVLQLDFFRGAGEKAGWIPFCYLRPETRGQGMGVQLIGEAVSRFRDRGLERIRLRCAPENAAAQRFYHRYGFRKIGEADDSPVPLDILEKDIR